ncbi:MAG TPA: hypothetical protein VHO24_12100 [Opitutaceae bacterium]|nr:hypothetical protein [Opitutaceae bacterium]
MKKQTHILYIVVILVVGAAAYGYARSERRVKAESLRLVEDNIQFRRRYMLLLKSIIDGNMELLKTDLAAGGARNTSTGPAQSLVRVTDETIWAMVSLKYADLFDHLRIPHGKYDLHYLLMGREKKRFEVVNMALSRGFDPSGDLTPLGKLIAEAQATVDADIEKFLGDKAAYEFFLEYERTIPQRNTVSLLRGRLAGSASPLTAEQEGKLIQILQATEKTPEAVTLGRMIYGGVLYHAKLTPETLEEAAAVLQPAQQKVLEGMIKRT